VGVPFEVEGSDIVVHFSALSQSWTEVPK
jgi:hypothetical protein